MKPYLYILAIIVCTMLCGRGYAQQVTLQGRNNLIEYYFPGGKAACDSFVRAVAHYPKKAIKDKIQGVCDLRITIDKDGTIKNVGIKNDIGDGCGEAAVELISKMKLNPLPTGMTSHIQVKFEL